MHTLDWYNDEYNKNKYKMKMHKIERRLNEQSAHKIIIKYTRLNAVQNAII